MAARQTHKSRAWRAPRLGLRTWLVLNELADGRVRSKHSFEKVSQRLPGGEKAVSNVLRFLWRRGLVEKSLAGPQGSYVYWISEEGEKALQWKDAKQWREKATATDPSLTSEDRA